MKYLLSQFIWVDDAPNPYWNLPHPTDRVIDLRNLLAQGTPVAQQGHMMIATDRDPLPGEIVIAEAFNQTLPDKSRDAVKDLLQIPENINVSTMPDLMDRLLGIYSDPSVGLICPPIMPDAQGLIQLKLGEISVAYRCPTSGAQWDIVLKVLQDTYRAIRAERSSPDIHRKYLSVLQSKLGVENHEVFIPADLPKETPVKPTTILRDNFNVGNHADISGQASSDGWTWSKVEGHATALFRTNTTNDAECINAHSGTNVCFYRAQSDLSSTDQFVQGIMRTNSNNEAVCLVARKDSSGTLTHYYVHLDSTNDRLTIAKRVAGAGTVLQNNTLTINTATAYTIRFMLNGSTLQTYNSGTQVGTNLTDTAISAGLRCGMLAFLSAGLGPETGGVEDFEASDILLEITGGTIASGSQLYPPTVAHEQNITGGTIGSGSQLYPPTVTLPLQPPTIPPGTVLYPPGGTTQLVFISSELIEWIINKVIRGIDFQLSRPLQLSIHTASPGGSGLFEVGTRLDLNTTDWDPADAAEIRTNIAKTFTGLTPGTGIGYLAVWNNDSAGTLLWEGTVQSFGEFGLEVDANGEFIVPAGQLVARFFDCSSEGYGMSVYLRNKILNKIFRDVDFNTYPTCLSLHDGEPGLTGANECDSPAYRRTRLVFAVWNAPDPVELTIDNFTQIRVLGVTGDASHFGLWDALIGGNFLLGGPLEEPLSNLLSGTVLRFRSLELKLYFNTCVIPEE